MRIAPTRRPLSLPSPPSPPPSRPRALLSTRCRERVLVPCGSAGHVSVDLFNRPADSPTAALLLHLPAFPATDASPARVPGFLDGLPLASINYRWHAAHHRWPAPVHDTALAFAWLACNLAPPGQARRDVYVYGSHLGASLAASLSLTEAHAHSRFGVRGLVAYNGVYNWTMFLPDHRVNRPSAAAAAEPRHLGRLRDAMPALFDKPSDLFDPFASPSLFFHNPGMLQPRSFSVSALDAAMIDALAGGPDAAPAPPKPPRKSHLVFPPRKSTLKIPPTLLLHDASPRAAARPGRGKAKPSGHSWAAQAEELAELMRRSVAVTEIKVRCKWDEDLVEDNEVRRRVQVVALAPETDSVELSDDGQATALEWLRERM